jgi:hypothetical protein
MFWASKKEFDRLNVNYHAARTHNEQLKAIGQALADENRDLVRQLELYKAVLAQLQIPIKLPARKQ